MEIEEQLGESPDPPKFDYSSWGLSANGTLYHRCYGIWWSRAKPWSKLKIEMDAFKDGRTIEQGGLGKVQHAKNALDLMFNWDVDNPGFLWTPEASILTEKACEHQYLGVCGSGSSGKSHWAAAWAWLLFAADPRFTKILCTSTSISAGKQRIWGSIIDLFNILPPEIKSFCKLNDSLNLVKYVDDDDALKSGTTRGIELVAAEPKQDQNAVAKLIGRKQRALILIADELPDLSPSVSTAFYSNLSRNKNSQMIGLGNPSSWFDPLGELCTPIGGIKSVSINSYAWETVRGYAVRFDDMVSMNYLEGKRRVEEAKAKNPGITDKELKKIGSERMCHHWRPSFWEIESDRVRDGENSLMFMRMSRGWFPAQGASDSIYSNSDLLANVHVGPIDWKEPPIPILSIDLSFSSGGDRTVMTHLEVGEAKDGRRMINYVHKEFLQDDSTREDSTRSAQICDQIRAYVEAHGIEHRHVAYDSTGGGAPFGDMLAGYLSREILPVCFGGRATDRPVSASNRNPSHTRYGNRVSEIWYAGVEVLRGKQFANLPREVMAEMCIRSYTTKAQGKIVVQPKSEIKAKTGKSPDLADSLMIGLDLCRERLYFSSVERGYTTMRDDDLMETIRNMDVVALSNNGQPEWFPSGV